MYYLVYTSDARFNPTEEELKSLCQQCVIKNQDYGITGLLLYIDGHYLQVLEGEQAAVKALYKIIQKDARHQKIITLIEGDLAERNFPDFQMGFKSQSAKEGLNFINLEQDKLTFPDNCQPNHPAILLLERFYGRLQHQRYSI